MLACFFVTFCVVSLLACVFCLLVCFLFVCSFFCWGSSLGYRVFPHCVCVCRSAWAGPRGTSSSAQCVGRRCDAAPSALPPGSAGWQQPLAVPPSVRCAAAHAATRPRWATACTDNADKGTDSADKGTENADKGTENADKGTENADKGNSMLAVALTAQVAATQSNSSTTRSDHCGM